MKYNIGYDMRGLIEERSNNNYDYAWILQFKNK